MPIPLKKLKPCCLGILKKIRILPDRGSTRFIERLQIKQLNENISDVKNHIESQRLTREEELITARDREEQLKTIVAEKDKELGISQYKLEEASLKLEQAAQFNESCQKKHEKITQAIAEQRDEALKQAAKLEGELSAWKTIKPNDKPESEAAPPAFHNVKREEPKTKHDTSL